MAGTEKEKWEKTLFFFSKFDSLFDPNRSETPAAAPAAASPRTARTATPPSCSCCRLGRPLRPESRRARASPPRAPSRAEGRGEGR